MEEPIGQMYGTSLSPEEASQHFRLQEMLIEFSKLFAYDDASERAIAIVGPAFIDTLLTEVLVNFLINDKKEVQKLVGTEAPLGTFGAKVSACYCLGLIGDIIKSDLRLVAKVRNRFAHELRATFSDQQIKSWCEALRWHKEALMCEPPSAATPRDVFQVAVNQLVCHLGGLVGLARLRKRRKSKSGSAGNES